MITNLCFHGIGTCTREREEGEARYWVGEHVFLGVLDAVAGRPDVRISFDDGNRSDVDIALPALRDRGLTASFFALAGRLDDPASLDAADLRGLRAAGMEIGTHGWTHIPWRGLSDADARRELLDSRVALTEASDGPVLDAALPLGRYDRRLLGRLRTAGYRTVYTSDRFPARAGSAFQARFSATATDTVESFAGLAGRGPSASDVRNLAKSLIKRLR
jgi:peptidoglycan/xylan/chitin deacetylase (PgdA/CDA1 family)